MSNARYVTDAELLVAAPHDVAAYEAFYRSHVRRVTGIAANVIRDLERRDARHQALVSKLAASERLDVDDLDQIEAAIDAAQLTCDLRDVLSAIPPGEQEMFRLVAAGRCGWSAIPAATSSTS